MLRPYRAQFRKRPASNGFPWGDVFVGLIALAIAAGLALGPITLRLSEGAHEADLLRIAHVQEVEAFERKALECLQRGREWSWETTTRMSLDGRCVRDPSADAGERWDMKPGKVDL